VGSDSLGSVFPSLRGLSTFVTLGIARESLTNGRLRGKARIPFFALHVDGDDTTRDRSQDFDDSALPPPRTAAEGVARGPDLGVGPQQVERGVTAVTRAERL
jgi:hypothetical protein